MNNNSFFAFLSRMKYINRWGLMHNSRFENLSEHSFETAIIAGALANLENELYGGNYDAEKITVHALFHDCAEIITGDLPTPVKHNNHALHAAYGDIERAAQDTLITGLPGELKEIYRGYMEEHPLIKAADRLSALIKCIEEREGGNRDFESAETAIRKDIENIQLKSVGYFMQNILPCYSMTLDELSREDNK